MGVDAEAGMKTALQCSHKNKKIIFRGLEKGVTLEGGEKILIPMMKQTEVHAHIQYSACY